MLIFAGKRVLDSQDPGELFKTLVTMDTPAVTPENVTSPAHALHDDQGIFICAPAAHGEACVTRSTSQDTVMPSTVIRTFSYDPVKRELAIVFQSGRRYIYKDVPVQVFEEMKTSFSKGDFFNTHIREHYSFIRK